MYGFHFVFLSSHGLEFSGYVAHQSERLPRTTLDNLGERCHKSLMLPVFTTEPPIQHPEIVTTCPSHLVFVKWGALCAPMLLSVRVLGTQRIKELSLLLTPTRAWRIQVYWVHRTVKERSPTSQMAAGVFSRCTHDENIEIASVNSKFGVLILAVFCCFGCWICQASPAWH